MKRAPIIHLTNQEMTTRRVTSDLKETNKTRMKNILILSSILFLAACGGGGGKSVDVLIEEGDMEALKAKKTEIAESMRASKAELTKIEKVLGKGEENKKLPLVTVLQINQELFNHYVELQGSVETDQNILVYPEFQGKLLSLKVSMGDRVSKGQVIATIDDGGLRQQLAQLEEQAALAKITYERQKRLWDQKIGSELDFLRSETTYNANEEAVKQMKKQLEKATVTAPFTGQIDETLADEGQLLAPGQTPILRIVNLSDMYIHSDVPEKYLKTVKKGRKVLVDLPVLDTIVTATVDKVSNYISPDNRTFKVEIDVPNQGGLIKPNLTAKLMINDYINETAILIPQSIISENSEGKQYVYKAESSKDGKTAIAKKVFVETGVTQGDNIEILSGLKQGDALIQEGARTVKDAQEVEIIK